SHAIRPPAGRRTRALPLPSPCDDSASDRQVSNRDLADARIAPRAELPLERPARPVAADRRPEERAHLPPAAADRQAGPGKRDADVEIPERPPDAAREPEFEPGDGRARPHDAGQLRERCRRVVDVPQEVGERERVELAVVEGEALCARLDELDAAVRTTARLGEHLRALVDPDYRAALLSDELARHRSGAGGDVEDAVPPPGVDPRDEEAPPAPVL